MNQTNKQSIKELTNQQIKQTINQLINQAIKQIIIKQTISQIQIP